MTSSRVSGADPDKQGRPSPPLCQACTARHRGICGALDPDQLKRLSQQTSKSVIEPGHGMPDSLASGERFANILGGVVKLSKLMSDGRQQVVGLQFAPDFLGRPFVRETSTTAEATSPVRLCTFSARALEEMIEESPELEHRLHEQALKELDEAREWMLTLGRKTASEKVASFLYLLATNIDPQHCARKEPVRFEIPLKRSDIADFLGLTTETVSRQITNLRKSGVISIEHNREVHIPEIDTLRAAMGN